MSKRLTALAVLYREAVEALERRRIPGVLMEPDAEAVLAKARAAGLPEEPKE